MPDESRDPELEWVRAHWDAPPPGRGFHDRILGAYVREAGRGSRRSRPALRTLLAIAAAAVLAAFLGGWLLAPRFSSPRPGAAGPYRLQPVAQPHFIVLSRGEHP
jgi:hypothetical protein